jgi:hypothetical protein
MENRNPRFADFERHLLDDNLEPLDPKFWGPPPSRWVKLWLRLTGR